ncbi:hypothetical protein M5K25_005724 [Dendrobium thyrsiflorum]|uniref:Uncharacterized protein n=1 Tax=Dendrobium thyrsiflorum TaxID=117978 RepID=A0ABD0VPU9_DENTH
MTFRSPETPISWPTPDVQSHPTSPVRRVSSDSPTSPETHGLLACGTGVGVSIFANKLPCVYASTCTSVTDAVNTRSINNCNVLCVSGMSTSPEDDLKILDAWLQTPFKSPCPTSGDELWPNEIESFLENSTGEMAQIRNPVSPSSNCAIYFLRKGMEFQPEEIMPGAEMKIVREGPTSAVVKFKAGSLEPAHHHTFGHDVLVMKGRKKGDYLFTPAKDKHRVNYFEDTEFFIRWDGDWDIFLDESLETAVDAIKVELEGIRHVSSDSPTSPETHGLLACGTGVGVSIFANKLPCVYASTCTSVTDAVNTRSINNCNVLCVSGMSTSPEDDLKILDA